MLACSVSDAYKKRKTTRFSFHDNMKESVATFMTWGSEEIDDCRGLTPHNVITCCGVE